MNVNCAHCGRELDPDSSLTARKVSGWEFPRQGGGLNALVLREQGDEYACWNCVDRLRHGLSVEQTSLV